MLKTFDPSQHSLAIGGSLIEFDEVSIEYDEDLNTMQVGTKGEQTRSVNLNQNAAWSVTLQQKSSSNQLLSALMLTNAVISLGLLDLEDGLTTAGCAEGVVKKKPTLPYGKESAQIEWTFHGKTIVNY